MVERRPLLLDSGTQAFSVMKDKLGDTGMILLEDQLQRWAELNESSLHSPLRNSFEAGSTSLPKGTLLHSTGMHRTDVETLESIAVHGLVSGELVGVAEDSETHGCEDFFKVTEDSSIGGYMAWAKERVTTGRVRHPRGENLLHRGVTFIIDPNAEGMKELLKRDGYTDLDMSAFVRPPNGRTPRDTAAILGGVPRGAIAGAIVSEHIQPEVIKKILELFNITVFTTEGERAT